MDVGWNTLNISIPQKFLRSQYLPPKQEFFSPCWPPFPPALVLQKTSGQFLLAIPFLKPTELRSRVWSPVVCLLEWKLAQFFKLNDPHLARLTSWKQYEKGFTLKEQNGEIRDIGNGLDTNWTIFYPCSKNGTSRWNFYCGQRGQTLQTASCFRLLTSSLLIHDLLYLFPYPYPSYPYPERGQALQAIVRFFLFPSARLLSPYPCPAMPAQPALHHWPHLGISELGREGGLPHKRAERRKVSTRRARKNFASHFIGSLLGLTIQILI